MSRLRRLLKWLFILGLTAFLCGVAAFGVLYWLVAPGLPSVQALRDVEYQVPLTVYSADGKLIALFGETRRTPVRIEDVPTQVKQAFIALEDARFYEHPGIDWRGIMRAVWLLATTDDRRVPGGSTITQQVAKMFFLSPEYDYMRKFREILLALKMERELSKDEILGLYLNKSFFGNRAYGIVAAAEFYYGKTLEQLTLPEAAMLASIPKFPSSGNPIVNPERAMIRRNYALLRMQELGFIDQQHYQTAVAEPSRASRHEPPVELEASYVAEMVRQTMVDRYGADAFTGGYRAHTTLESRIQEAANSSIRSALLAYDRRHGWRGAEGHVDLPEAVTPAFAQQALRDYRQLGGLLPALVTSVGQNDAVLTLADGQEATLQMAQLRWAAPFVTADRRGATPRKPADVLAPGDIVRISRSAEGDFELAQIPAAQGALVTLSAEDGAILALNGGFSFGINKFNRATQALRQPGSSFKPFVYAAAFERGFHPGSIVLDAPVVFHDRSTGSSWRPSNDNNTFSGPMRLREAMVTSRNLVSVRILDAIGANYAKRYIQGFGFPAESLPENLSLALGTSSAPPLAAARGYAVFANGGYLVDPYVLSHVEDRNGVVIFSERAPRACRDCPQRFGQGDGQVAGFNLGDAAPTEPSTNNESGPPDVLLAPRAVDERTAFLIHSILRDVIQRGTGRAARVLNRTDIGGKTGTTNDYRDAWFSGFGANIVTSAWVGMDDFSSLGSREYGGTAALPMWIDTMRAALDGVPESTPPIPNGIVTALIDPYTGLLAPAGTPGAISEFMKVEDAARVESASNESNRNGTTERESFDIF
ncbi:penicillin-binding protein 1A [Xanthomonadaceae bacterium JHOS43]|nr:penicillin-binding protein 1A [Xanthomonadaceae bacterium JHOS43]MCX7563075.1 penicillin-binding protein 1A [Xanthomonadaceae bacterium XH05]